MVLQNGAATRVECVIAVAPIFLDYLDAAAARLQILYPRAVLDRRPDGVCAGNLSADESIRLRRDLLHLLYREKVYAETLPMRLALMQAVTDR